MYNDSMSTKPKDYGPVICNHVPQTRARARMIVWQMCRALPLHCLRRDFCYTGGGGGGGANYRGCNVWLIAWISWKKSQSPLYPGGGMAMVTNDWCFGIN